MSFVAPSHFFTQRISIDVIGAGGTGSYLLSYLAQIHYLLRMVGGNDNPFDVTVWDRDTVSETNVGRQNSGRWILDSKKQKCWWKELITGSVRGGQLNALTFLPQAP